MPLPHFNFKRHSSNDIQKVQSNQDVRSLQKSNGPNLDIGQQNGQNMLGAPLTMSTSRTPSFMSSMSVQDDDHRSRNQNKNDGGPLGLTVVYTPDAGNHKADIVFIHGLGGTSRYTWTRDRNPALFWPMQFLPLESDIDQARIMTFGYNANFRRKGGVSISISDFAKDLLFDLKYAKDEATEELNIGSVPLVFVVHSMGGLIIKEAYLLGQNDPEYELIVKAISAIIFLATPHRGTNLASMLNGILQSTFLNSSKQYIADLNQNSIALQRLNDQFRHIAPKLDIVSFYETRPTSLGFKNASVMILEKDSSILGYPGEVSKALDADHHNVCKFDSPQDPNYIFVRNALKTLLSKILTPKQAPKRPLLPARRVSRDLKALLGIADTPDVDYIFYQDQWAEGTSNWILEDNAYTTWFDPAPSQECGARVLWLNGGPATGKSVLSSFIINDLVKQGLCCQYFFIRFGEQKKRGLSMLLRSIAYQLASSVPAFSERAFDIADEGINFESADARTVWECLFKSVLADLADVPQPLYWIIDGIDEAADPRAVIKQFTDIFLSSLSVRILLVSRKTPDISAAFQKIPTALSPESISIEAHQGDLHRYVSQELSMAATTEYRESVIDRIIGASQNNFLWVRLAVDQVNSCHTQADVDLALQQLPVGMEALYDRMALSIAARQSPADRALATAILECVMCSSRVLTIAELAQALNEDTSKILDLQISVLDLCAGFVVIDNSSNVAMIHQTAREYLLDVENERPISVRRDAANARMLASCIRSLMAVGLRAKIQGQQPPEFLDYAATSWSKHLALTSYDQSPAIEALYKFLNGPWILTWIHYLSSTNQLSALVHAARHLSTHFAQRRQYRATQIEDSSQFLKQGLLEGWSVDLIKIVGKFGTTLRRTPDAIYKLIPPFCPQNSSLYQIFGKMEARNLAISGFSSDTWDDCVARISLGLNNFTSSIAAAGAHIAILASAGPAMSVLIYESSTFEELSSSPIRHGERVHKMIFNSTGTVLTTYGYKTTKVWDVSTGQCKVSVDNYETGQRPLAMLLINNNSHLLVGTDDRCLRFLDLTEENPAWNVISELEEPEIEGLNLNAASCMALSRDGSLIAVAYRGHPLSAWETDGPMHLGHCWRTREEVTFGQVIDAAWNPHSPELFGLYIEGTMFRWRPYDDEREEIPARASKLSISRDGNLVATGDVRGTIKVYTTADLGLLYQLTSEDTVLGLAFSPDLRRIYDIRGYHVNAWEPNALIKFAEQRGKGADNGSETESLALSSMSPANNRSGRVDSVTVLAASPMGRFHAYGNDKGTVVLYDTRNQKASNIFTAKNFLSIEQMVWSHDGTHLSFTLSGKRIVVMSIDIANGVGDHNADSPAATTEADIPLKPRGANVPISQLLFHSDSRQMAIFSASTIQVISLDTKSVIKSVALPTTADCKWVTHPYDANLILGVMAKSIIVVDWDLVKRKTFSFEFPSLEADPSDDNGRKNLVPAPTTVDQEKANVDRVLLTQGRQKLMLVQISLQDASSKKRLLLRFDSAWFSASPFAPETEAASNGTTNETNTRTNESPEAMDGVLSPTHFLPQEVASDVALALSFLANERLVYLSRRFAICTWQMSTGSFSAGGRTSISSLNAASSNGRNPPTPLLSRGSGTASSPSLLGDEGQTAMAKSGGIALPTRGSPLNGFRNSSASASRTPSITAAGPKSVTTMSTVKPLFYLPGDWINRDSLILSTLWAREKSLLCPRNGEVAVVKCSALA